MSKLMHLAWLKEVGWRLSSSLMLRRHASMVHCGVLEPAVQAFALRAVRA